VEDLAKTVPAVTIPVTGGVLPGVEAAPYDKAPVPVPAQGYRLEYRVKTPPFLYAPVRAGQSVGEVEILLDGVEVARLSLTAARNIALAVEFEEEVGVWERIKNWLASPPVGEARNS
jgi:D-alanyl-D-alanine carboxypeptidase/D-alanyl-D-alanine carboxypeptidase (penicillin-binding protein 5/6)